MSTCCSTVRCYEEKDTIVGTSTSWSTSCVTRKAARIGTSKGRILGTSITCSGSGESTRKNCSMSGNWSTTCGTGTSSAGTGRCPTTCRRTRDCQPATSDRGAGRPPWGRGASGTWPCSASRASHPALAVFWRCAQWCVDSARAIATAIRSRRKCERRRRCLRRRALPVPPPASSRAAINNEGTRKGQRKMGNQTELITLEQDGAWWWWCGGEGGAGGRRMDWDTMFVTSGKPP